MAKKNRGRGGKVRQHDRPKAKKGCPDPDRIYYRKSAPQSWKQIHRMGTNDYIEVPSWTEAKKMLQARHPGCRIRESPDMFVVAKTRGMREYTVQVKVADPSVWEKVFDVLNQVRACMVSFGDDRSILTANVEYDPNHPLDAALPGVLDHWVRELLEKGMISWSTPLGGLSREQPQSEESSMP